MSEIRKCSECHKSGEEIPLFDIILPPEITERTSFCKSCLMVAVDNTKKKNEVKSKEKEY